MSRDVSPLVLLPLAVDPITNSQLLTVETPKTAAQLPPGKPKSRTTAAMSQWIDIFKALMLLQIICFHHDNANRYAKQQYAHLFLPHVLSHYGLACNQIFFAFAGYLSLYHFEKLESKSIKDFSLLFAKQYAKRYVQLRAAFLIFALGYQPFLYVVFGENGRGAVFEVVRLRKFWLDVLLPVYYPPRANWKYIQAMVGPSSWFLMQLLNIEPVFFLFYYLQHLARKLCRNELVWAWSYIVVISTALVICVCLGLLSENFIYYLAGNLMFVLRVQFSRDKIASAFSKAYASKHAVVWRTALCCISYYAWLVAGRNTPVYSVACLFIVLPIALDLFPPVTLGAVLQRLVKEINRMQMELYLLHSPFLESEMPRGMPQVVTKDFTYMNPVTINWFMAWQYPLLFMQLSYPLWFLVKPLTEFVDWVDDRIKKKPIQWRQFGLSMASIACTVVITTLQQAGVFGRGHCDPAGIRLHDFQS